MKTIDALQGTAEWLEHRANHFNASDAPAMMGLSPYTTRSELLRQMATGIRPEIDAATQRRFDDGHRFEALARPEAEKILGDALFPVVGYEGKLSASFDGLTMDELVCFEHKTLNAAYREAIATGSKLPPALLVQIEQQLMLADAARCLFMASKWEKAPGTDEEPGKVYGYAFDENGEFARYVLVEEVHCFVESDPELRKKLLQGWAQFEVDLSNYEHVEVAERPAPAVTIELPALFVHAKGEITDSNMKAYGEALALRLAEVRAIALVTDQDFSNAKQSAAMLRDQCAKMKLTKEAMLSQTVTIGEAARMMDAWSEDMRVTALKLEKDVEREDAAKKAAIVAAARSEYAEHINELNRRIGGVWMPSVAPDFTGAIKGKRSYTSMTDAVDAMLANAKVDADMMADRIEANSKSLDAGNGESHEGMDYRFLVPDFATVCTKQHDDFNALVTSRLAAYRAAESKKAEDAKKAEEARIAAAVEAERKAGEARAEAVRIAAAAESERIRKEEADKLATENAQRDQIATGVGVLKIGADGVEHVPVDELRPALAPDEKRAVVEGAGDDVRKFMATLDLSDKERGWLRARLMAFVQFQAELALKAAA